MCIVDYWSKALIDVTITLFPPMIPLINVDITHNHVHDHITDSRDLLYEIENDRQELPRVKALSFKIIRAKN